MEVAGISLEDLQQKCSSFAADGASVMQGDASGVGTRLIAENSPFLFTMHCATHRISLVCKALADLSSFKKVDSVLRTVYGYFCRSAKRSDAFLEIQKSLKCHSKDIENTHVYKVLQVHDIRFISVYGVLERFVVVYPALLDFFLEESNNGEPEPVQVLHSLRDLDLALLAEVYRPLLSELEHVSKATQADDVYLHDVSAIIAEAVSAVRAAYLSPVAFRGERWRAFNRLATESEATSPLKWRGTRLVYVTSSGSEHEMHYLPAGTRGARAAYSAPVASSVAFNNVYQGVIAQAKQAAEQVVADIATRFPPSSTLDALSVIHHKYWLRDAQVLEQEFRADMETLRSLFCTPARLVNGHVVQAPLDYALLDNQAPFFASYMQETASTGKFTDTASFWLFVDARKPLQARMSEWYKLARRVLGMPIGSVSNERRFASMTRIRTALRNRLLSPHLNTCVRAEGSYFQYDTFPVMQAYDVWCKRRDRYKV